MTLDIAKYVYLLPVIIVASDCFIVNEEAKHVFYSTQQIVREDLIFGHVKLSQLVFHF